MSVLESPHTKQCWGIDASGLGDDEWHVFEASYNHTIRWSQRLWICYAPKGEKPHDRFGDQEGGRQWHFFRIEEPPTPRGKKVTILPGAKGL